ncbi:MAG: hypothetical protein WC028_29155 [Candidatus Obscuribacterales bacterium]
MITHNSGLELLKRREASIRDGCQILLFLISTTHDEHLLKMYNSFARDIDDSVGPACIAFAYMSVPEVCPDWPDLQQNPQNSEIKWSTYHQEMTKAAFAVKKHLGLKSYSLPSLLLLEPELKEQVSFLSLRDNRFAKEFLDQLKRKILRWYERDPRAIRKNDLRMLSAMNRHAGRTTGREKAIQDGSLINNVVPRLSELLEGDINKLDKAGQHRLRKILTRLRSKPRDLCKLVSFMDEYSFNVTGSDIAISASTLETVYDKLIEEFVQKPSESACKEFEQVAFPVDCLKNFDEFNDYIELTSPTRKLLQESRDIANNSGWWEVIGEMVPQGFEL